MRSILRQDGYRVFEDGNILGVRGNILTQHKTKQGYYQVDLLSKTHLVHRIVATAFLPNPENKPCINHKDGDKSNNCPSNLEWVTYKENSRHSFDTGLQPSKKGENNGRSVLSNEDVKDILRDHKHRYWGWAKATADRYGVDPTTISRIVTRKNHNP